MATIEKFEPYEIPGKDWGQEIVVAQTEQYLGKCLKMRAGFGGALQYHQAKLESFFLYEGTVDVDWIDDEGTFHRERMFPGQAYHVPIGAPHRVTAVVDSVLFETSVPVFEDRVKIAEPVHANRIE